MTTATADGLGTEVSRRDRGFGIFGAVLGVLGLVLFSGAEGQTTFVLRLQNAAVDIPDLTVSATGLIVAVALAGIALGSLQAVRGSDGREVLYLGVTVILFLLAFLTWGAAGESVNVISLLRSTIRSSTPLALGALAGVLCEKAGIINIAIEGQLLAGALVAAVASSIAGPWVGLLAAMFGALAIGMILAVLSIRFRADQVIVGVVLVVFSGGLTAFLIQQLPATLNQPTRFRAFQIPVLSDIPIIGPLLFGQTLIVYLALAGVAFVTWLLFSTRWGLRVRSVGEKPKAADTVGVSVPRMRYQAVAVGSLFAGMGGAFYTLDSSGQFSRDMTNGAGFIALAAVLVGRHHPVGAFGAAIVFGFAEALATAMSVIGVPISSNLLETAPYVVTILVVAGVVGRHRVPAAGGQPYVTE
jgi:simple sugar transport system permease protein